MKISMLTTALVGLLFTSSCAAFTENQVRILFNNGVAAPGMSCSTFDMFWVKQSLILTRRNLRQGSSKANEEQQSVEVSDSSNGIGRKLPVIFYPASCKTACRGYASGTCLSPACKGFRREMQEMNDEDRDLQIDEVWCTVAKDKVHTILNVLTTGLLISKSCVKLLKAPRQLECLKVTC